MYPQQPIHSLMSGLSAPGLGGDAWSQSAPMAWPTVPSRLNVQETGGPVQSFQSVLSGMVQEVNAAAQKPDALMQQALTTGKVDIHEVMVANTEAELTVTLASGMLTKFIQAYDRVLQIQI